ncbi:MAG: hypothetical protein HZB18_17860 [Chloroflexi bacterium]|nr:hypothetical protein [Chloroflexota bacterium]
MKPPIGHTNSPFAHESASADFNVLRQGFSPPNQRIEYTSRYMLLHFQPPNQRKEYTPGIAQFGGDKSPSQFVEVG